MARSCGCGGSKKGGTGTKYVVVYADGSKSSAYSDQTTARMEASQNPGARVRQV